MEAAPFRRVLVVGAGLMGTSLALALKRRWPEARLTAMDPVLHRHDAFDHHLKATSPIPSCDLAVLACPLGTEHGWLERLAERPDLPVTDLLSVKRFVCAAASQLGMREFVGGHPMAGGTHPGPRDARADLFDGRAWWMVRGGAADGTVSRIVAMIEGCGATVFEASAEDHDRAVAATSHLPQLVASLLMATVNDAAGHAALLAAGPGLRDATRLADSPDRMWQTLLAENASHVAPLLRALGERAIATASALDDPMVIARLFAEAHAGRRRMTPL